jgi:hypothetical protein
MNTKKPQPVIVVMAVLAGLDVILGGVVLAEFIPKNVIGLIVLLLGGIKVGVGLFLRESVVPASDVGAYLNAQRNMVAGPAAAVQTESAARVVAADPSHGVTDAPR